MMLLLRIAYARFSLSGTGYDTRTGVFKKHCEDNIDMRQSRVKNRHIDAPSST